MRYRILFVVLLLLALSISCSNKNSDQASPAGDQSPATTDQSSTTATPATSEPAEPSAAAAKPKPQRVTSSERSGDKAAPAKPAAAVAITIPADTAITVRTQSALSSGTNHAGDTFSATVAEPVMVDGKEVVPSGAQAEGTVTEATAKGKVKGAASLRLELTRLTINGTPYPIQTSMAGFSQKGKGKRTAVTTGGGAALGAIIGGIAGGGKGAAIGALAGGGAGFAGGTLTGNKQIELPAETALTFKLKDSVTLK